LYFLPKIVTILNILYTETVTNFIPKAIQLDEHTFVNILG
jgi:hypothetical protein